MSTYLLKNATVITFSPPTVEHADVRIVDGRILAKAEQLEAQPEETILDLTGKILMPGLVCAHTHLYSTLARGMPGPQKAPTNFPEILEQIWWRLDRALDEESIYYSTVIGVLEAIASGTTTIIDHHASPRCIRGSLKIMKAVFEELGVRGVLCYEVTDRGGMMERDLGVAENCWMLEHQSDLVKGLVGAHAAFTLSDHSLRLCTELVQIYHSGLHIHLAEGQCDVDTSYKQYGKGLVARLQHAGALNAKSLLAHGVHLTDAELRELDEIGCWLVHNPRSNMNNSVGYAPAAKFGSKTALGTDGITSNMFEEAKFAYFKAQDAGSGLTADDCMSLLAGGHQLATELFGTPVGTLNAGAAADLIVLDYPRPTPLHPGNLAWHLIFGLSHAHVESVMIGGKFLLRDRGFVGHDIVALYQKAQEAAKKLWKRMILV